jgi:type IV pilus assembly protein PilE
MKNRDKDNGFTLIELMIVVAILGIVVAFGYPAYRDQIIKSRRAEGMGELLELADRMERYYSDQGTYAGATLGTNATDVYPAVSQKGYYSFSFTGAPDAISFTINSAPTTKGGQNKDMCGTFTLTSLGVKSVSCGAACLDDCWK